MNETMVEQQTEIDVFNSGCDLVLSHVESFIDNLEASEDDVATRYDKVKRLIAGMRLTVNKRRAPREESSIILPDQNIVT
jgi:hypothetical protein